MILATSLPTFERLFPSFKAECQTLYTVLLPIAIVLVVVGLIAAIKHASTPNSLLPPLITTLLIVVAIAFWAQWINEAQDAMKSVISAMNADPLGTAQKYVDILVSKEEPKQKAGWFGLPSAAQMYEAVLWGILSLIGIAAHFLIWAAYILQRFLLGLGYAFAPLFLGLLALRSTSGIAFRYIMGIVGIIAWPLGWAAASIGTSNLIDVATEQGLVVVSNVYGLQTIMAAAIIGGWIILTTLIAPIIIQSAIASGAQIGSALLGGALTAGTAAISAGATAATTLGTAGVGTAGMVAGSSAAAGSSLAGSAMQGGGPAMSGSMVAQLARPWWTMPTASGNGSNGSHPKATDAGEGGGNAASSATPARFDPSDPTNSRAVEDMIRRDRGNQTT